MRHSNLLVCAIGLAVVLTPRLSAAQSRTITIRVLATDSTGAPIADADVSLVRGLNAVLAHGTTNVTGKRQLVLSRAEGDYQVVVRKVGYTRSDLFFTVAARDTLSFDVRVARALAVLDTVTVNAESAIRLREYHINADQIANSSRAVADGWDVVERLRPEMISSLLGQRDNVTGYHYTGTAPPLQAVFVNGHRIFLTTTDQMFWSRLRTSRTFGAVMSPSDREPGRAIEAAAILASIHSEHIAEMHYVPPSENTGDVNQGGNAVFVVLKLGVSFEPGRGSFIANDSLARPMLAAYPTDGFKRYRFRLLGVYDEVSGSPIANVKVIEASHGDWVLTSMTGTVSLFFVPDGGSRLRFEGVGYDAKTLDVSISPTDTLPVVVTLRKSKPNAPSYDPL
jgi:hypothetical protein